MFEHEVRQFAQYVQVTDAELSLAVVEQVRFRIMLRQPMARAGNEPEQLGYRIDEVDNLRDEEQ